jgi:hypothetical protein
MFASVMPAGMPKLALSLLDGDMVLIEGIVALWNFWLSLFKLRRVLRAIPVSQFGRMARDVCFSRRAQNWASTCTGRTPRNAGRVAGVVDVRPANCAFGGRVRPA